MTNNNNKLHIYLPIIISLSIIIGILIGTKLNFRNTGDNFISYPTPDKLSTVLDYISQEYVDSISKDDLIEMTIPEILANLDPHSIYIPASELEEMNEPLEGNFEGIGVQFNILHDTIIVVNTISGGPAEKRGVMPGDRIVKINDTIVAGIGISTTTVMKKLKGRRGTDVTISVKRKKLKDLINITITRDKIPLESVDVAYMINNNTGYIKISKFAKTTYHEFISAVKKLHQEGMKNIILDLRNNAGGYMDGATNIADEFLEEGKLIVYTEGHSRPRRTIYATSRNLCIDDQLIILIDEWSASASEILAGAIQDNDRGLIIGRRSFGKGLVQEPTFFSDGSSIRLTVARYYTPTGRCIQKPYNNGTDDYYNELTNRYLHGELEVKDSIRFADSLKYTTPGGRIVYGGGGIMPDIFVPVDTSGINKYYTEVVSKGLLYEFAFNYTDNHRNELNSIKDYKQLDDYLDDNILLNSFTEFASKNGVDFDANQVSEAKILIITMIKAYIGRNILDDIGFYPFIKDVDETIIRAIKEFSKNQELQIIQNQIYSKTSGKE